MSLKVFMKKLNDLSLTGGNGDLVMVGQASQVAGSNGQEYIGTNAQNGDQVVLCFTDSAGNYEVSQCTVTIVGSLCTISRDTVIASSAGTNTKATLVGTIKVTNYVPTSLELVLFNLTYQTTAQATLAAMAADISDMKDALSILIDGNN